MRLTAPLACAAGLLLVAACSTPASKYGADTLQRVDKDGSGTPVYLTMGKLGYSGENAKSAATRVMTSACSLGHPRLMSSVTQAIATDTYNGNIFIAMFTCDAPIPDAD
jgi:hypothetical protein